MRFIPRASTCPGRKATFCGKTYPVTTGTAGAAMAMNGVHASKPRSSVQRSAIMESCGSERPVGSKRSSLLTHSRAIRHGPLVKNYPRCTKPVPRLDKPRSKRCFLHRHVHLTTLRQQHISAFRLRVAVQRQRPVHPSYRLKALRRHIARHDHRVPSCDLCVQKRLFHFGFMLPASEACTCVIIAVTLAPRCSTKSGRPGAVAAVVEIRMQPHLSLSFALFTRKLKGRNQRSSIAFLPATTGLCQHGLPIPRHLFFEHTQRAGLLMARRPDQQLQQHGRQRDAFSRQPVMYIAPSSSARSAVNIPSVSSLRSRSARMLLAMPSPNCCNPRSLQYPRTILTALEATSLALRGTNRDLNVCLVVPYIN